MQRAIAIDDLIALGGQGALEREVGIEAFAVLLEVDDAQVLGLLDRDGGVLPIGAKAALDADAGALRIDEAAVR